MLVHELGLAWEPTVMESLQGMKLMRLQWPSRFIQKPTLYKLPYCNRHFTLAASLPFGVVMYVHR
jgi:hypothetical protein